MATEYTDRAGLNAPDGADPIRNGDNQLRDLAARLDAGIPWGGRCFVATEERRTSDAFGLMPTPDIVEDVVLSDGALLHVAYRAMVRGNGNQRGEARIYLNEEPVKIDVIAPGGTSSSAPMAEETLFGDSAGTLWQKLMTTPGGMGTAAGYGGLGNDVTTGQILGSVMREIGSPIYGISGICSIFAAAGTFDVSIRFRNDVASWVDAKDRRLWVWTQPFSGFGA